MRAVPGTNLRHHVLPLCCAVAAWGVVGIASAPAQSGGLDMDASSNTPLARDSNPGAPAVRSRPETEAPAESTPAKAPVHPFVGDGLQAGPPASIPTPMPAQATATLTPPSVASLAPGSSTVPPAVPETVSLDHPKVIDTARLQAGETTISLFGIEGLSGASAQGLQTYLEAIDQHLTCQAQPAASFVCLLSDGTDLAQVALVNGAARTMPDAPEAYREQEAAAQAARRGIWVNLPPPPEMVIHPTVPDTATLAANGKIYRLDGVQGFGQPYAGQLQGYISGNGDSLTCSQQQASGNYVCLLPDGTDIAKVALVNGAARVEIDAPDAYRVQQADALNNHRGFWLNPPPGALVATAPAQPDEYAFVAGDQGMDGVSYVGGAPTALIGGETVFLVYGDAFGWGYYDHGHHWHDAPDRYRAHMEHYHPYGRGLRGYGHEASFHHDEAFRREEGMHREETFRREEGAHREEAMHRETAIHPGGLAGHPAMQTRAEPHPAMGPRANLAGHPAVAASPMGHPAGAAGGGFVHPGAMASAGGFHPGGLAAAGGVHPGAAAPVAHVTAAASINKHH